MTKSMNEPSGTVPQAQSEFYRNHRGVTKGRHALVGLCGGEEDTVGQEVPGCGRRAEKFGLSIWKLQELPESFRKMVGGL